MEVEFLHSEEPWLEELEKPRLPIFQRGKRRSRESKRLCTECNMGSMEEKGASWEWAGVQVGTIARGPGDSTIS